MAHRRAVLHARGQFDSIPVEFQIGMLGGWHLIGIGAVPPILRSKTAPPDQTRRQFLDFHLAELGSSSTFDEFVQTVSVSAPDLKGLPGCYTVGSSLPGLSRSTGFGPSRRDRVDAAVVLMRVGYLAIDGTPVPGVTRSTGRVSLEGGRFIRSEEGDGSHMYWPGNETSGVTVGPGYDMGNRQAGDVASALIDVDVAPDIAAKAAAGAGLIGKAAGEFVDKHRSEMKLTSGQQGLLFTKVVPHYEDFVTRFLCGSLKGRLYQNEFDALVSLAYNVAGFSSHDVAKDVNRLDFVSAIPAWLTLTGGGAGIPDRRRRETGIFQDASYICKALP